MVLLKNTIKHSIALGTNVLLFLLLILAGRSLGAEDFGRLSFALAFVFLFDPLMDPGLYHFLIREMARHKEKTQRYLSHALTWKLVITPVILVLIYVTVNVIHDSTQTLHAVYWMALAGLFKSYKDPFRTALLAHEYFGWDAVSLIFERTGLLLFGAWVLLAGKGLLPFCMAFAVVRMVDLCFIGWIVRKKVCGVSLGQDMTFVKEMVLTAFPIGAFYMTLNFYHYTDMVLISIFRSEAEVGWYGAAYKIYEGVLIFPVIIGTVLMPRLSRHFHEHEEAFHDLLVRGMKYIAVLSLTVMCNGFLFSDFFVPLFFGADFEASIPAMKILFLGVLFMFNLNYLQTAMITMDQQKRVFYFTVLGLVLNIALNAFWIPRYGFLGSAVATVVAEAAVYVGLLSSLNIRIHQVKRWLTFGKPVVAMCLPAALVFWALPQNALVWKGIALNMGFVALLLIMKFFDREEIASVLGVVGLKAVKA